MIHQLVGSDDPVLRERTELIPEWTRKHLQLVEDLYNTLAVHEGIGLAAPQIGKSIRLFVMDIGGRKYSCANPRIIRAEPDTDMMMEGCLSFPGERVPVVRPVRIYVEYLNLNGTKKTHWMAGLVARCFMHELDHLDGIVMHDRVDQVVECSIP